jgi:hypothetical protein
MGQLVPYIRNPDGSLIRVADGIYQSSSKQLDPYLFEQRLIGWPESRVFWEKPFGPSVGVAPSTEDLGSLSNTATSGGQ